MAGQYTLNIPQNPVTMMGYDSTSANYKAFDIAATGIGAGANTVTAIAYDVSSLPSYASGVRAPLELDKTSGALIINQGALAYTLDSVASYVGNVAPVTGDSTMSYFQTGNLTNSFVTVKSSPGNLYSWNIINPTASTAYVKLYNAPAGNLATGTAAPIRTFLIPATSQLTQAVNGCSQYYFTGLSILSTTILSNQTNQAAPTSALTAEFQYK